MCSALASAIEFGALTTITPLRGGRFDVDVVDTDAGAPDHDELVGRVEHCRSDLGGTANDQGVRAVNRADQLVGRETEPHIDLEPRIAQGIETALGQLLGDEHTGHGAEARPHPAHAPNGLTVGRATTRVGQCRVDLSP